MKPAIVGHFIHHSCCAANPPGVKSQMLSYQVVVAGKLQERAHAMTNSKQALHVFSSFLCNLMTGSEQAAMLPEDC